MKLARFFVAAWLSVGVFTVAACVEDEPQGATPPSDAGSGSLPADATVSEGGQFDAGDDAQTEDASTVDPAQPFRSGTRLRARVLVSGSLRVMRWLEDSELEDMRCDFRKAQDGRVRCMPERFSAYDENFETRGLISYLDAECTQPIVVRYATACEDVRRYARVPDVASCEGCSTAREVLQQVAPTQQVYFRFPGQECSSEPVRADLEYFTVSAPLEATRLVAVEDAEVVDGDGRLQGVGFATEDGAFVARYVRDREAPAEQNECHYWQDTDGQTRCFNQWLRSSMFADDQCTQMVINGASSDTVGDRLLASLPYGACGSVRVAEFTLLEQTSGGAYHPAADGTCVSLAPGSAVGWRVGPPEPPTSTRVDLVPVGEGPVRRRRAQALDGTTHHIGVGCQNCPLARSVERLVDTNTGRECWIEQTGPDTFACLPLLHDSGRYFADAQCTERVSVVAPGCAEDYAIGDDETLACGETVARIYQLGPVERMRPYVVSSLSGDCAPAFSEQEVRRWQQEVSAQFPQFREERE